VNDITVRHEDGGYLEEGYTSKINTYKLLLPILAEQLHASPGTVLPVVSISNRQKGFVHESGCFNNVHILDELLREANQERYYSGSIRYIQSI